MERASHIDLVITVALADELPTEWLEEIGHPPLHFSTLKGLAPASLASCLPRHGVLLLITGVGLQASAAAAQWIQTHVAPTFVVNLGTAGRIDGSLPPDTWLTPRQVCDEEGSLLAVDVRIPIPLAGAQRRFVASLRSVRRPVRSREGHQVAALVDMEAFAQARQFAQSGTAFSVLKMVTDDADGRIDGDFAARLPAVRGRVRELLDFLQPVSQLPVAVVIPVRDRADHIQACIDSVLAQSEPAEEVIVVDDASSDATVQRVLAYGDAVRLLRLPGHRGVSAARNTGIQAASASWIALLDSDDRWRPDKLAAQRRFVRRHPHYRILQSEEIWIRRGQRVNRHKHHAKPHGWVWRPSLKRCLISPSAVLLHRDLIAECGGFDEALPVCEDYDLWLRISRWHPVGLDKTPSLMKYSGHADQLSMRLHAMDRFRVYAMLKALRHEQEGEHRQALLEVLEEKLRILAAGSEKRGRMDSAHGYRQLWQQALAGDVDMEDGWMLR